MVNGIPMYDTDAAAFDNSVERHGGNLRWQNALAFKSLELPNSARKPAGHIWAPGVTKDQSQNKNYDRLILNWAESERGWEPITDEKRRGAATSRLDAKINDIVEKYCRVDQKALPE